ncbi:spike base protein, RCAP_Rcc01079 family [Kaistia sp. MMO-174]|uniref:spike base protein, RCAP_Rcc01079 family n=1 Tax=Kaistia sp. MMO-174 TaxID=3081256 RepID=UPI00301AA827
MPNPSPNYGFQISGPGTRHFAVTPSNTADLSIQPRALYIASGTTVAIRDEGGVDITYPVTAGQILPFRGVRILATGTDATVIGWY